jgi:hypothetical protein
MSMDTLLFLFGCSVGTCFGFLLAAFFKVGGSSDDPQLGNNGEGIRLCGPPEKMLKNNVKAMDRGIED